MAFTLKSCRDLSVDAAVVLTPEHSSNNRCRQDKTKVCRRFSMLVLIINKASIINVVHVVHVVDTRDGLNARTYQQSSTT